MAARRKVFIWIFVVFLVLGCIFLGGSLRVYLYKMERFPQDFKIWGIDVSGLDKEEAKAVVESHVYKLMDLSIVLRYQKKEWKLNPQDIGFDIDVSATVEQAFTSLFDPRFSSFIPVRRKLSEVTEPDLVYQLDKNRLVEFLDKIYREVVVLPRNASFIINPDETVSVSNSTMGVGIDTVWAMEEIQKVLFSEKGRTVVLKTINLEPATSKETLLATGITGLIAEYRTTFDSTDESRTHNIKLVAQAIDGVILRPQEVFSFNKIVGPRTKERGYKDATVIINSEKSIDVGGGICQVSSTLYNAALLANLSIVERYHHSLAVTYISPGRDATVSYDHLDLKFSNTEKTHILIRVSVVGEQVVVKIYGKPDLRRQVSVKVTEYENIPFTTRDVLDPSLPKGVTEVRTEGSPGYRALVTRMVYEDGVEVFREKISEDILKPQERVVHIGTGN
jgi:vancomycin resistance protein YoaR